MYRGIQALLRDKGQALGAVTHLLREISTLRCANPKLAAVMSHQGNGLRLDWLDMAQELDFTLTLWLGKLAAWVEVACTAEIPQACAAGLK